MNQCISARNVKKGMHVCIHDIVYLVTKVSHSKSGMNPKSSKVRLDTDDPDTYIILASNEDIQVVKRKGETE